MFSCTLLGKTKTIILPSKDHDKMMNPSVWLMLLFIKGHSAELQSVFLKRRSPTRVNCVDDHKHHLESKQETFRVSNVSSSTKKKKNKNHRFRIVWVERHFLLHV